MQEATHPTRKTWQTPQIVRIGAEHTRSSGNPATKETSIHTSPTSGYPFSSSFVPDAYTSV